MKQSTILLSGLLLIALGATANASIISIGSAFTLHPTNAPDTFSTATTFGGTKSVDGGAATLTMSQSATGPNGEWDIWTLTTDDGSAIAGNTSANWNITMDYVLSQNVYFDGVLNQWTKDGTPVSPLTNFGGICCAVANNPATGGPGYYNNSFSSPISAGPVINWQQIFINPYSFAATGGIPVDDANGFTWALHLTLQSPAATPLPGALPLFVSGLGGLGLLGWRRRRKKAAVALAA